MNSNRRDCAKEWESPFLDFACGAALSPQRPWSTPSQNRRLSRVGDRRAERSEDGNYGGAGVPIFLVSPH